MQKNENFNDENENLFNSSFFKKVNRSRKSTSQDTTDNSTKSILSSTDIPLDGSDKSSITDHISEIIDSAIKDMEKNSDSSNSVGRIVITKGGFSGLDPLIEEEEDSKMACNISDFIRAFFGEDQLEAFLVDRGYSISKTNDGEDEYKTATKEGVDTKYYDLYEICEFIEFPNIILKWLRGLDKN